MSSPIFILKNNKILVMPLHLKKITFDDVSPIFLIIMHTCIEFGMPPLSSAKITPEKAQPHDSDTENI